jgi:hypothetical protein
MRDDNDFDIRYLFPLGKEYSYWGEVIGRPGYVPCI